MGSFCSTAAAVSVVETSTKDIVMNEAIPAAPRWSLGEGNTELTRLRDPDVLETLIKWQRTRTVEAFSRDE